MKTLLPLSFDLNNPEDYNNVEAFIEKEWTHVDILINNAISIINKPFAETTFDEFQNVYGTNVFGVAELTRRVLPFIPSDGHSHHRFYGRCAGLNEICRIIGLQFK